MSIATRLPAIPAPAGSIDLAEVVAWLPCRRRTTADVHRVLEPLLAGLDPGSPRELFLVLEDLEELDGSLTGFLLGLEATLRASGRAVTIADPAGFAPLVLAPPEPGSRVRVLRSELLRHPRRPVLVVDVSGPCGDVLSGVLDALRLPRVLAQSGAEARRALRSAQPSRVVVDLDHPGVEGLELAGLCRGDAWGVVGLTFLRDPWASDAARRFGFRRILSKPARIADILGD
jgi:CheY-like chemotaxis protein